MRLSIVLAVIALAGCRPNVKALELRQANEAVTRGDYVVAAEHFGRACELDPGDAKACSQATRTAHTAVDEAVAAAQQLFAQSRYPEAIVRLVAARPVDAEGKTGPLLDDVGARLASQCEAHPLESLTDAVRLVRCLETNRVDLDRAAYSARTKDGRARASALAAKLGAESDRAGHVASAYAQFGVAQCLASSPESDAAKSEHYARFYQRTSVPFVASVRFPWGAPGLSATELCESVRARSPIVLCGAAGGPRGLTLDASAAVGSVVHDQTTTAKEIEYVDHVETYENPDWQPLQNQLGRQRRLVQQQRNQTDRDVADCETANAAWQRENSCNVCRAHTWRDSECNRADASRQNLDSQVTEYRRLERQANDTPRLLEREVRDVFRYREATHHYGEHYELAATATGEGRNQPYARNGDVSFVRSEHVGFAKAGLDASPLTAPQPQDYRSEIVARTRDFVETAAAAELGARAKAKLASCTNPRDPAQLDCWLEGQFLQTPDPLVPYTAILAEDAGRAYPPAGCK